MVHLQTLPSADFPAPAAETQKAAASLLAFLPAAGTADQQAVSPRHQVEGKACRLVEGRVDLVEEGRGDRLVVEGNRARRERDLVLLGCQRFHVWG